MLSPFTPPGTKIVCINDDVKAGCLPGLVYSTKHDLGGIRVGCVYTLKEILPSNISVGGYIALIEEIDRGVQLSGIDVGEPVGFSIIRFRKAELPSCLTEILNSVPIKKKERA